MKHLFIVRHAQSTANARHRASGGQDDAPLSEIGRQQARLAGQNAKRFFRFDTVVSSPLGRTRQTAGIIAAEIGYPSERIILMDELRERNLGAAEGRPLGEVPDQYAATVQAIESIPGIEPLDEFYQRMERAYQKLQDLAGDTVLVIAHNGCGRMLKTVAEGRPAAEFYRQARLENAVIYKIL